MPEDPSLLALVLYVAVMLVAGLVHGTLGLGFPLIATPLLALIMDLRTAILMTLVPTVTVTVVSIIRGGSWRQSIGTFWPLALYTLVGSGVGAYVLTFSDPAPFKLLLAGLVFLYLGANHIGALEMSWVKDHHRPSMLAFGVVAGFSAGTTNVSSPILIIYTLELGLPAIAMVQIFNLCFLAGKLAQIGVFSGSGLFDLQTAVATLPLAGVALAALFIGVRVRERIPTEIYRQVTRGVMLVVALLLVGQYFL